MVGTALAVGSTLAGLWGQLQSARANKATDELLRTRQSELENWYNREYNTPYLDTSAGQSAMRSLRTYYGDAMKKVNQQSAIAGASDEARIATGDRVQRGMAEYINRLAGYGTQYRDAIRREHTMRQSNLDNLQMQRQAQQDQNWQNFMRNTAQLAGAGIEAEGMGAFDGYGGKIAEWFRGLKATRHPGNPYRPMLKGMADRARIPNMFNK
jgi:hypothetical protein